jgi:hypothetical protein
MTADPDAKAPATGGVRGRARRQGRCNPSATPSTGSEGEETCFSSRFGKSQVRSPPVGAERIRRVCSAGRTAILRPGATGCVRARGAGRTSRLSVPTFQSCRAVSSCRAPRCWFGGAGPGFVAAAAGARSRSQARSRWAIVARRFSRSASLPHVLLVGLAVGWWSFRRRQVETALRESEGATR